MRITFSRKNKKNELSLSLKNIETLIKRISDKRHMETTLRFHDTISHLPDGYGMSKSTETWTHVYPAAEYVKDSNDNMVFKSATGLLLLSFTDVSDIDNAKCNAQMLPSTVAVTESVDGNGVHVMVNYTDENGKLPTDETSATGLYETAIAYASKIYKTVVDGTLQVSAKNLHDNFLMTYDPKPFFNDKAVPLKVNRKARRTDIDWQQGETVVAETENEDLEMPVDRKIMTNINRMITYLTDKYDYRYNMVMKYTEYVQKDGWQMYRPVDPRIQKQMTLEVQLAGIKVSIKDVRNFLESNMIKNYYPIDDYLFECDGKWDGKDHIRALARTVPTENPYWEKWFYTWFLAMVNQWRSSDKRTYGNSIVPLLISKQGYNKSTFCRRLVPDDLQWGYNDNLVLTEKHQVLQAMSQFLLINLDEFNQISPSVQQGFLKNLVQLPSVKVKRPYGKHVEEFPRIASFIATSNIDDVLSDPSGSRRFLCVEVTGPINVSRRPNYEQLFAQALAALDRGEKPYFDISSTSEIIEWNSKYQTEMPVEQYFFEIFDIAENKEHGEYMTVAAIFKVLKQEFGSMIAESSLISFGRRLKNINGIIRRRSRKGTEYLVIRRN